MSSIPLSEQYLQKRAAVFVTAYPDLYALAYETARKIVHKHTGKYLDPAKIYWHRFNNADDNKLCISGWQHSGPPIESMTMVELVMRRFKVGDAASPDELDSWGGFYWVDAHEALYNDTNEVKIRPSSVLADFWELDFAAKCSDQIKVFWRDHSEDFSLFAKIQLIGAAASEMSRGHLDSRDFLTLFSAAVGTRDIDAALSYLSESRMPPEGVTIQLLTVAGTESRGALHITDPQGRQIIYCPDVVRPFQCFADESALYEHLRDQAADPAAAKMLAVQFARDPEAQGLFIKNVAQHTLHPWSIAQQLVRRSAAQTSTAVFNQLRDKARKEMEEDVEHQLTTGSSLRKQYWIGFLGAFMQVAGGLSPLSWPIALSVVGAGLAVVGLNIDQALNGRTAQLRKSGLQGAIFNSIFMFFNLPLMASLGRVTRALPAMASVGDDFLLERLAGGQSLEDVPMVTATGHARGVHELSNGEDWIVLAGNAYRVSYFSDLKSWAIIDPDNPFEFNNVRPVHLNAQDRWQLSFMPEEPGTPEPEPMPTAEHPFVTTDSPFWDIYMQVNPFEEERLSDRGNLRQETLMDIYQAEDDEMFSDSSRDDAVIDPFGEKIRVFKSHDDVFYGGYITRYSRDGRPFNRLLRSGERVGNDQVTMIGRLIEDLSMIECNNDVPLYRGGSSERGTSGVVFREGRLKAGDVLVNTDFTSFSENPYVARTFSSSQGGESTLATDDPITFDDTSVVFQLPAKQYFGARPVSPFSASPDEVESLFMPGNYFRIQRIEEVKGPSYRFMRVQLRQIPAEQVKGPAYDLRTGELFSRERYAQMLGEDASVLADIFFPQA
ncbi:dermonecrotic toxin domain-containing protein [Pseudomonas sp. NPDC090202]|uniref:dermonecrotic toxin domain-containing protein n=1 Tax=unclassified Pseudomonas TaxID=196821 RepID=UPI00382583C4